MGLVASESGIKKVDQVREKMGYGKTSEILQEKVSVSSSTLKRFWYGKIIDEDNFRNICYVFGFTDEIIDNEIVDWENSTTPRKIHNSENQFPPFGYKGCIKHNEIFFDRQDIFKTLYQNLKLDWNCSLVGETQIGKSSILWKLSQEGHIPLKLSQKALIYIDLQKSGSSSDIFLKELSQQLNLKIDNHTNGFDIQRKLSNKCFIVCLDEMEVLSRFSTDDLGGILSLLRGLSETQNLTFVTASRTPLLQLFPDSPNQPSPLNNFHVIDVKPFTEADARAFINYRLQDTKIKFTNEQIDQLIHDSQCHPAKLQEQAHQLYSSLINE